MPRRVVCYERLILKKIKNKKETFILCFQKSLAPYSTK